MKTRVRETAFVLRAIVLYAGGCMRHAWMFVPLALGSCGPSPGGETSATVATSEESGSASASSATATPSATGTTAEPFEPPPVICPDQPTTGPGTGEPPALCPENPHTDACCCFDDVGRQDNTSEGTVSVCGLHALCPTMRLRCAEGRISEVTDCPLEELTTDDIAAIDCSLKTMLDGAIGRISWQTEDGLLGWAHEAGQLDLVGDGTIFSSGDRHIDLYWETYAVVRLPLPDSPFFTECAKAPDWRDRFGCIREALSCAPIETCVDGYFLDPSQG